MVKQSRAGPDALRDACYPDFAHALFYDREVRNACSVADVVIPSLDAGDEFLFQYINRPQQPLTLSQVVDGLTAFRKEYSGAFWLELFLLTGVNAMASKVTAMKRLIDRIEPDKVHLNTAVRPTAEEYAFRVPEEQMLSLCPLFGPTAEVIADFRKIHDKPEYRAKQEDVLGLLQRRPCSVSDVAEGLSIHRNEALKFIGELQDRGRIRPHVRDRTAYYAAVTS